MQTTEFCQCFTCINMPELGMLNPTTLRLVVCSKCGNKRCPAGTNHEYECTNSNEPGQLGSRYANTRMIDDFDDQFAKVFAHPPTSAINLTAYWLAIGDPDNEWYDKPQQLLYDCLRELHHRKMGWKE